MTITNVKKHPRRGTKGVKRHSRNVNNDRSVPHDLDERVVEDIESLVKREEDLKEWLKGFENPIEFEQKEKNRIKEFSRINSLIEGLKNDPFIPEKRIQQSFKDVSGSELPFSQKSYMDDPEYIMGTRMVAKPPPEVSPQQIQMAVQQIVPKYEYESNRLLNNAMRTAPNITPSMSMNENMRLVKDWGSYWSYLNYTRKSYVDISKMTREHKSYPTVKFLDNHINREVSKIDSQIAWRRQTHLFKQSMRR